MPSTVIIVKNGFLTAGVKLKAGAKAADVASAKRIEVRARARAPRQTGYLEEHIRAHGPEVVATARYSGYQERGTSKMPAHPFFFDSVRDEEPVHTAEVAAVLRSL
jgi:HK97 gp10 family phage protein